MYSNNLDILIYEHIFQAPLVLHYCMPQWFACGPWGERIFPRLRVYLRSLYHRQYPVCCQSCYRCSAFASWRWSSRSRASPFRFLLCPSQILSPSYSVQSNGCATQVLPIDFIVMDHYYLYLQKLQLKLLLTNPLPLMLLWWRHPEIGRQLSEVSFWVMAS